MRTDVSFVKSLTFCLLPSSTDNLSKLSRDPEPRVRSGSKLFDKLLGIPETIYSTSQFCREKQKKTAQKK